MCVRDQARHPQAQPESALVWNRDGTRDAIEDPFFILRRDPRTMVRDPDQGAPRLRLDGISDWTLSASALKGARSS